MRGSVNLDHLGGIHLSGDIAKEEAMISAGPVEL